MYTIKSKSRNMFSLEILRREGDLIEPNIMQNFKVVSLNYGNKSTIQKSSKTILKRKPVDLRIFLTGAFQFPCFLNSIPNPSPSNLRRLISRCNTHTHLRLRNRNQALLSDSGPHIQCCYHSRNSPDHPC